MATPETPLRTTLRLGRRQLVETGGKSPGSQGAAAVEFALVLPLFIVLLFGVVEFGLIMDAKGIITHASREGARYGVVYRLTPKTKADIETYVQNYLQEAGFTGATVTATPGNPLSVKVDYPYHFAALPAFIAGLSGPLTLSAETTMRME
jgi:Flp pilus assembly protein TadG